MEYLLYSVVYGFLWRLVLDYPYLIAVGLALWYFRDRLPNPARRFRRRQRIARLEAQVTVNPENAEDRTELGELLVEAGRPVDAVRHLSEAARKAPDSAGIQFLLGLAHLRAGAPREAIGPLAEAARLNKGLRYGEPLLRLGEARAAMGQPQAAAESLAAHLAVNGSSAEGLYRLAALRAAEGDRDGARRAVEELREVFRQSPRFRRRLDRPWLRRASRLQLPRGAGAPA